MSLTKRYLKSKPVCKVTFKIEKEAANGAEAASLVGDFNDWDAASTPMKALKSGGFTVTIDLETAQEYQYRYVLDDDKWENDWEADKYVPNGQGEDNSVVVL